MSRFQTRRPGIALGIMLAGLCGLASAVPGAGTGDVPATPAAAAPPSGTTPPLAVIPLPPAPLLAAPLLAPWPAAAAALQAAEGGTRARTGHDVLQAFHDGLAQPGCDDVRASPRWRRHFAQAPAVLASSEGPALSLFAHVVDALRQAHLPTEFALIPFVESGYRADARNAHGPAGLWQFVAATARAHRVPVRPGHDGRLSPVESTRAAVRYLKTLYGMFGGDWRLAVMAFNAGEHRILRAMRNAGVSAMEARPSELPGLAPVTRDYVEKLHALACVIDEASQDPGWRQALDREVTRLP